MIKKIKLTHNSIKNLPIKNKIYRVADSDGLAIEVRTSGSKIWRFRFRYLRKPSMISLGFFPEVSLLKARAKTIELKKKLSKGIYPTQNNSNFENEFLNFKQVYELYTEHFKKSWTEKTYTTKKQRYYLYYKPIGNLNIKKISAKTIIDLILQIEKKVIYTSKKCKSELSAVFKFAVSMGFAERNPVADISNSIFAKHKAKNYSFTQELNYISWMLNKFDFHQLTNHNYCVKIALKIAPYLFLRPKELVGISWNEVDFHNKIIIINEEKMKMKKAHSVPLSNYLIEILKEAKKMNNFFHPESHQIFPSKRTSSGHITPESLTVYLRRLGISKDKFSIHGFRHFASTTLNEKGFNRDVIEKQLSHSSQSSVRGVYNHAQYMEKRIVMMNWWSAFLISIKNKKPEPPLPHQNL